jgi:hypothetical protein
VIPHGRKVTRSPSEGAATRQVDLPRLATAHPYSCRRRASRAGPGGRVASAS